MRGPHNDLPGRALQRRTFDWSSADEGRLDPERHLDFRVPESTLHDVRRDARRQHQRGHGVAQAVKLDALDARLLDQRAELSFPDGVHLKRQAERVGPVMQVAPFLRKHQTEVVIVLSNTTTSPLRPPQSSRHPAKDALFCACFRPSARVPSQDDSPVRSAVEKPPETSLPRP